jgi:hypothetical protein
LQHANVSGGTDVGATSMMSAREHNSVAAANERMQL